MDAIGCREWRRLASPTRDRTFATHVAKQTERRATRLARGSLGCVIYLRDARRGAATSIGHVGRSEQQTIALGRCATDSRHELAELLGMAIGRARARSFVGA